MDDNEKAETVTYSEMPEERQMRLRIQEQLLLGNSPTLFVRLATRHYYRELFGNEPALVEASDE